MSNANRYPLAWPVGFKRTKNRQRSKFRRTGRSYRDRAWTVAEGTDEVEKQLRLMGCLKGAVLSTNVELTLSGRPYSNRRSPDDPGAALYFTRGKHPQVIACDKWDRVADNIRALAKTLEAMRGLDRWGCSEVIERAFTGFKALPDGGNLDHWWDLLGVSASCTYEDARAAHARLARQWHPDTNSDPAAAATFTRLNEAWQRAQLHFQRRRLTA